MINAEISIECHEFLISSKIPFHYKISINYGNFHQSGNPAKLVEEV